jgi:hypothetical protein
MGHYAFLDENNVVTEVITGRNEDEVVDGISDWEAYYGEFRGQTCKRTSYNTKGGQHLLDGTPFRGNYAGTGYTYDETLDAFIPPSPFPSWILSETTFLWEPPVARPDDAWTPENQDGVRYAWDEDSTGWVVVPDEELPA